MYSAYYFWYSVLPNVGLLRPKHVVTKLLYISNTLSSDCWSYSILLFVITTVWVKLPFIEDVRVFSEKNMRPGWQQVSVFQLSVRCVGTQKSPWL